MNLSEKYRNFLDKIGAHMKAICGILAVLVLILGITAGNALSQNSSISQSYENKIGKVNEELETLKTQVSARDSDVGKLESELKSQSDANAKLQQQLDDANKKIGELSELENQQSVIDSLNQQISLLSSENETLKQQVSDLQTQLTAKNTAQVSAGSEKNSGIGGSTSSGGKTVYWVSGGEVYHSTPNCSTLKRSKNVQSGTIEKSGKSRPCKVCH